MAITIPDQHVPVFDQLLHLSPEGRNELVLQLDRIEPGLSVPAIQDAVATSGLLEPKAARATVVALSGLYMLLGQANADGAPELVRNLIEALKAREELDTDGLPESAWDEFQSFLFLLLSSTGGFAISMKALLVANERARALKSTSIYTEMRPVFAGTGDDLAPVAAVITHELQLRYYEGDADRQFTVTLDDADVARFVETLRRAQQKSRALRPTLEAAGLTHLAWRDGTDE